ncbi:unnamed protein product, partial [marine sediment metagenome]
YIFYNYGDPGNKVSYAEASFSGAGGGGNITTITKATSAWAGLWGVAGLTFSKNNYDLPAGTNDIVKIIIDDTITSDTTRDLVPLVTVNTSSMVPTELPSGKTNTVQFTIPPPVGLGMIYPNEMFSTTTIKTNYFVYTIYNDGKGSNELLEAVIYISALLNGQVTALSNSWQPGTTSFTNYADRIIINYSGDPLDVQTNDKIYLQVINNV